MARCERVEFEGVVYRRYPDSERWSDRQYFRPSGGTGKQALHREVYMAHHGPIPDGWHVHHLDGDTSNNDPANLEALPAFDHLSHHGRENPPAPPSPAALAAAAEWHRSPEGREWHSQHAKDIWAERKAFTIQCEQCGTEFEDISHHAKFCSNNCKSAARRASGVDDEDRECAACGGPFRCNRYMPTKCCSKACVWDLRRRNAAGLQPVAGD